MSSAPGVVFRSSALATACGLVCGLASALAPGLALCVPGAVARAEPPAEQAGSPAADAPGARDPIDTDPSITDNSVSATRDQLVRRRGEAQEVRAVGAGKAAKPRLAYPEGTFLSKVEGTLLRVSTGDLVFTPTSAASGTPPLVLLPNLALQRLESAATTGDAFAEGGPVGDLSSSRRVVISGEAFVYRGRVYLLASVFSLPVDDAPAPAADAPKDASPNAKPAAETGADTPPEGVPETSDPGVQELIRDLESRRSLPRALDPAAAQAPTEPPPSKISTRSSPAAVTPEGTLVEARRGRVVRAAGGGLIFVPDSSSSAPGKSPTDSPMGLLPCKLLETIEAHGGGALPAEGRGDQHQFRISGRVVVYRGRNYLLPTLAQRLPVGDVTPLQ